MKNKAQLESFVVFISLPVKEGDNCILHSLASYITSCTIKVRCNINTFYMQNYND